MPVFKAQLPFYVSDAVSFCEVKKRVTIPAVLDVIEDQKRMAKDFELMDLATIVYAEKVLGHVKFGYCAK